MAVSDNASMADYSLALIGHKAENFDPTTGTPAGPAERKLAQIYEPSRDALLSGHPWKFAMRRVNFDVNDFAEDISGATQADPVVLTVTGTSRAVGDSVYVWSSGGMTEINQTIYTVGAAGVNSISLYKQDRVNTIDGSAYSAYTSGGYVRPCPLSEFDYMFPLPSDCLTFWGLIRPGQHDWTEENGFLLTNMSDLEGRYIMKVLDVTDFHSAFIETFAIKLAYIMAGSLDTTVKKSDLLIQYKDSLYTAYQQEAMIKNEKTRGYKRDPAEDIGWQAGKVI